MAVIKIVLTIAESAGGSSFTEVTNCLTGTHFEFALEGQGETN